MQLAQDNWCACRKPCDARATSNVCHHERARTRRCSSQMKWIVARALALSGCYRGCTWNSSPADSCSDSSDCDHGTMRAAAATGSGKATRRSTTTVMQVRRLPSMASVRRSARRALSARIRASNGPRSATRRQSRGCATLGACAHSVATKITRRSRATSRARRRATPRSRSRSSNAKSRTRAMDLRSFTTTAHRRCRVKRSSASSCWTRSPGTDPIASSPRSIVRSHGRAANQ